MQIRVGRGDIAKRKAEAVVLAVPEGGRLSGPVRAIDRASRGSISALFELGDFNGRFLQSAVLYPRGLGAPRVILVGLGAVADLDPRRIQQAAAVLARRARDLRVSRMVTAIPDVESSRLSPSRTAQAFCEGLVLGDYRFAAYRREPVTGPGSVVILARDSAQSRALEDPVVRGARWAEATCVWRAIWPGRQDRISRPSTWPIALATSRAAWELVSRSSGCHSSSAREWARCSRSGEAASTLRASSSSSIGRGRPAAVRWW